VTIYPVSPASPLPPAALATIAAVTPDQRHANDFPTARARLPVKIDCLDHRLGGAPTIASVTLAPAIGLYRRWNPRDRCLVEVLAASADLSATYPFTATHVRCV
jgi:hypothetical protein